MNKTKIEWTDYTWNPVTGCRNACWYCYAKKIACRFQGNFIPKFHKDRLEDFTPFMRIKKNSKIFVCSMADLFGEWLPDEWIRPIIDIAKVYQGYIFQFLTKNPKRYQKFKFTENCWLGETRTEWMNPDYGLSPYAGNQHNIRFVSLEPLLGPVNISDKIPHDWIIIGAMTGPGSKKYAPKAEWIENILRQADRFNTPIFMKGNLKPYYNGEFRQEFPLTASNRGMNV
jgi:protein gp37